MGFFSPIQRVILATDDETYIYNIVRETKLAPQTVYQTIKWLEKRKLATTQKIGKKRTVKLTDRGQKIREILLQLYNETQDLLKKKNK